MTKKMTQEEKLDLLMRAFSLPPAQAARILYDAAKGNEVKGVMPLWIKILKAGPAQGRLVAEHLEALVSKDIV